MRENIKKVVINAIIRSLNILFCKENQRCYDFVSLLYIQPSHSRGHNNSLLNVKAKYIVKKK